MITVEEFKKYKKVAKELIEVIKSRIDESCSDYDYGNYLEDDFTFENDNTAYDLWQIEGSSWEDNDGRCKYYSRTLTYQLVSYDKNIRGYAYEDNIIDKYNLFVSRTETRTGSYYSDWNYTYDKPVVKIAKIKHIPMQVIPAYDEIVFTEQNS